MFWKRKKAKLQHFRDAHQLLLHHFLARALRQLHYAECKLSFTVKAARRLDIPLPTPIILLSRSQVLINFLTHSIHQWVSAALEQPHELYCMTAQWQQHKKKDKINILKCQFISCIISKVRIFKHQTRDQLFALAGKDSQAYSYSCNNGQLSCQTRSWAALCRPTSQTES